MPEPRITLLTNRQVRALVAALIFVKGPDAEIGVGEACKLAKEIMEGTASEAEKTMVKGADAPPGLDE